MIKADNQLAFCIEHGMLLTGGSGFTPSELTIAEKERLSFFRYSCQCNLLRYRCELVYKNPLSNHPEQNHSKKVTTIFKQALFHDIISSKDEK